MNTTKFFLVAGLFTFSFESDSFAAEQLGEFSCAEPSLNIDFEDESQVRMLEHDFKSYEDCYFDYIQAAETVLTTHQQKLSLEKPEESWANESEEVVLERLQASLTALTESQEKLKNAEGALTDLVARIIEYIPASEFNQWNVESKVAE